jgi:hypothetical protein
MSNYNSSRNNNNEDPFAIFARTIADGIFCVKDKIGELFEEKENDLPIDETNKLEGVGEKKSIVIPTPQPSSSNKYIIPEYCYLSDSERSLITPSIESLILNLRSLIVDKKDVRFEEFESKVYSCIPDSMVSAFVDAVDAYCSLPSSPFVGRETYEEILKRYMDSVNCVPSFIGNIESKLGTAVKVFNVIIKLLNKFTSGTRKTLDWDIIPIKPIILALLWTFLLMELTSKYLTSREELDKRCIAKMAISLLLALFAGFTGYMHSGGNAGFPSITSYIRKYYNAQLWLENDRTFDLNLIPQCLKFKEYLDYSNLLKYKQIDAAKGINMVYTFRIGDTLLMNLFDKRMFSERVVKQALKSLWPLPSDIEARKMYRLYKESKIYSLL